MTKTTLIAALLATNASAQSRVFYDVAGRNIGSATKPYLSNLLIDALERAAR